MAMIASTTATSSNVKPLLAFMVVFTPEMVFKSLLNSENLIISTLDEFVGGLEKLGLNRPVRPGRNREYRRSPARRQIRGGRALRRGISDVHQILVAPGIRCGNLGHVGAVPSPEACMVDFPNAKVGDL